MSKSPKKVAAKKSAAKTNGKTNPLHEKLLKLFLRPNGATLQETTAAGANRPAIAALNLFKAKGYKRKKIWRTYSLHSEEVMSTSVAMALGAFLVLIPSA